MNKGRMKHLYVVVERSHGSCLDNSNLSGLYRARRRCKYNINTPSAHGSNHIIILTPLNRITSSTELSHISWCYNFMQY